MSLWGEKNSAAVLWGFRSRLGIRQIGMWAVPSQPLTAPATSTGSCILEWNANDYKFL